MTIFQNRIKDDNFKYLPKKEKGGKVCSHNSIICSFNDKKSNSKWLGVCKEGHFLLKVGNS